MDKKSEYGDNGECDSAAKRNGWHFLVVLIIMINQFMSPVYAYESLTKENLSPHLTFEIDETTKNILSETTVLVNQDVLISLNFQNNVSTLTTIELGSSVRLNMEQTLLLNDPKVELNFDEHRNSVEIKSQELPLSSIKLSALMANEGSNVLTVVQEAGQRTELTIISNNLSKREAVTEVGKPVSKVNAFSDETDQKVVSSSSELPSESEVEMVDTSELFNYSGTTQHLSDLVVDLTGKTRLSGQMWSKKKIDLNAPFQLEFNTYLGDAHAERVADGITLVFRNGEATHVGEWGSGMGAYGNKLGKASVLEFDTFYNTKRNSKITGDHDEEFTNLRLDNNNHVGHVAIRNSDPFDNVSSHDVLAMGTKSEPIANGKWLPVKYNWDPDANGGTGQISGSIGTISFVKDYNIRDHVSDPESVIWGITSSTGLYETHQAVYFTKVKIGNNLTILKVDEENRPLAGAKFDVVNKETNELIKEGIISNEEGEGSHYLPIGNYIVRETEAPEGYLASTEEIDVIITERNYVSGVSIVVENKKQMEPGDLVGEKTVSPRQAKTGDIVTYNITASNTKADSLLTGVTIGDDLSTSLRLLPESIRLNDKAVEASVESNGFVVTVGELAGLKDAVVTFKAKVVQDEDKPIKNTASISADDSGFLQPEVSLPVVESVGTLGGSKIVSPTTAKLGEIVTYTIKAENTKENSSLKEVLISDKLPDGVTLLPESIQLNGKMVEAEVKDNGFVVIVGNLIGKSDAIVTFQAEVTQDYDGKIENVGLVSAKEVSSIHLKTDLSIVESIGILKGSKSVAPIRAKTGEIVTYTIKAENTKGSSSLNNLKIGDKLSDGLSLLPETIQLNGKPVKAEIKDNSFTVNVGSLLGKSESIVTFQAKVMQDYDGEIENVGLISGQGVEAINPKTILSVTESVGTLSGSKSVSPTKAKLGEIVTYTIKAENRKESSTLNSVTINDKLPEGLVLLPETIQLNGKPIEAEVKANGFVVSVGNLVSKSEAVVTFQARVTQDYDSEIENVGLVSSKDVNSIHPKTILSVVESVGTLSGSKSVSSTKAKLGEIVTYTIKAGNTKVNSSLNDVIISDKLPIGLSLLPETIQLNGKPVKAEIKDNGFTVNVGSLFGKSEADVTFQTKVTQDYDGKIENIGLISGQNVEAIHPKTTISVIESTGSLSGSKSVSPTKAKLGEIVTYTIKAENTKANSSLNSVIISDKLPEGLAILPESIQLNGKPVKAEVKDNSFTVNIGNLVGKSESIVTFQAKVMQDYDGKLENIGLISGKDVNSIHPKTTLSVVESIGILSGSKSVSPTKAKLDEIVTYTIKASNTKDNSSSNDVKIGDKLPGGLSLLPETIQLNGKPVKAEVKDNSFTVNIGNLVGKSESIVTFQAKVMQDYDGKLENIGLISGKDVNSIHPKTTLSVVESIGILSGSKSVSPTKAKLDEIVTYTIKASNTKDNSSSNDVKIGDKLPGGLSLLPETIQLNEKPLKAEVKDNSFTVNVGNLVGKSESIVTFQAKVTQDYDGEIENAGLISGRDVEAIHPKTSLSIVESTGILSGSKSVSPTKAKLGEIVTYTIKAGNIKADSSLNNVKIGDELPEGLLLLPESIQLNGKSVKTEVKDNSFVVNVGNLIGEAESIVTFQGKVTQDYDGDIKNTGSISAQNSETIHPAVTLSIAESVGTLRGSKTVAPTKAKLGEIVTYTIKAENRKESSTLNSVIISDKLPDGLSLLPETIQLNEKPVKAEVKDNSFTVNIGNLVGKSESIVTFQAKVMQDYDGKLENIGLISGKDVNSIYPKTDLSIVESIGILKGSKSVAPIRAKTGEIVTYTIKAENTKGSSSLNDVKIEDELPEGLILLPESIQLNGKSVKTEVKDNSFVVNVGNLVGKAESIVTFQAKVAQDHDGEIENVGLISGQDVKVIHPKTTLSVMESVGTLSGSKLVSPIRAKTGEIVTYTIKAGNIKANSSLNNVKIEDDLPEGLILLPESIQLNGKSVKTEVKDNSFTVNVGNLVGKSEAEVTFQAKVAQDYDGEIENVGLISGQSVEAIYPKTILSVTESVGTLSGSKSVSPTKAKLGEIVTYTIKASNTKVNSSLNDVLISDVLPDGLSLMPETIQLNGESAKAEVNDNHFTVNVGSLNGKTEAIVTFQGKVTQDYDGDIKNTGSISAQNSETIHPAVTLSIAESVGTLRGSKTVAPTEAKLGEIVTYTLKAENRKKSSSLNSVIISDKLPDGLSLLPETIQLNGKPVKAEIKDNGFTVNVGSLFGKSEATVTFQAKIMQDYDGEIENIGLISGKDVNSIQPKTTLSVVESTGMLSGSKSVSSTKAKLGEIVTYTIKAGNTKVNSSLNDVKIGDKLPDGLSLLPETIQLNGKPVKVEIKDNTFTVNVGNLVGKTEAIVTFQTKVTQDYDGEIENIGLISGRNVEAIHPKTTISVVESTGILSGSKSVSSTKAKLGEIVTYTIKASNTKVNSSLNDVKIGDKLPGGLSLLPETIQLNGKPVKAEIKDNSFTVNIGNLVGKSESIVTFQAKVMQDYDGKLENIGLISGRDVEAIHPKTSLSIMESVGILSGSKSVSSTKAKLGEIVTYTIKASNAKDNSSLNDVSISDELPDGLSLLPETIQLNGESVEAELKANGFVVNVGDLVGKKDAIVTFQTKVTQDYDGKLENIGLISGRNVEAIHPKTSLSITESVGTLSGSKSVSSTKAKLGEIVTYTIKAGNTKVNSSLNSVIISDKLPGGLSLLPETIQLNGKPVKAEIKDNSFTTNVGDFVGKTEATVTFQAKVMQDYDGEIENIGLISAKDANSIHPKTTLSIVESTGSLSGSKSVSPTKAKLGEIVTYTIKASNTKDNSSSNDVKIGDKLPDGLSLLPETIQLNGKPVKAEVKDNSFTVNVGNLVGKTEATVTFQAKVMQDYDGEIENVGLVSSKDANSIHPKTTLSVVESIGILSGSKSVSPTKAKLGEIVTYTIKAGNTKVNSSLNDVSISDELPDGLSLLPETIQLNGKPVKAEIKDNSFTVNIGKLLDKSEADVTFQAKVMQDYDGKIENVGLISGRDVEVIHPKTSLSITESVGTLSGSKSVLPAKAKLGEIVTFTLKGSNVKDNSSLNDVSISDELPEGLVLLPESIQLNGKPIEAEVKANGFVVNVGALGGKEEAIVTFQAEITQDYDGEIENIGLISAKDINSIQPKTTLSVVESVGTLNGSKSVSPIKAKTGEQVTYTIKAENTKVNSSLINVVIGDELPEGVTLLPETIQLNGKPVKAEVKNNSVIVKAGNLVGKSEAIVTFQVKVTQEYDGEIKNIASIKENKSNTIQAEAIMTVTGLAKVLTHDNSKLVEVTTKKRLPATGNQSEKMRRLLIVVGIVMSLIIVSTWYLKRRAVKVTE